MTETLHLQVDAARVGRELEQLASYSDAPAPAVTRVLFTPPDIEARSFLKGLCEEAGFAVRQDALGNIFVRFEGSEPDLPAVATGSHVDAIPYSGRYDGTVGVLGGLEAMRALKNAGFTPRRAIELIIFTSEEPTRFALGCLGSRAMSGALGPDTLRQLRDADGVTLEEARLSAGCTGELEEVQLAPGVYHAFVELHIEQGPTLEWSGLSIGVVTAIAAPAALRVVIEGVGGHAGGTLMLGRRDALLAASELALAVEAAAHGTGSNDSVATVGVLEVHPGAVNSIPSRVKTEIDIRDVDLELRDWMVAQIRAALDGICARRGVSASVETINSDPPATCATAIIEAAGRACQTLGFVPFQEQVSRAYHDSLFMARLCPTGMIFIPCRDGVSHRPDEYSSPEEIKRGIETLTLTLATLSK